MFYLYVCLTALKWESDEPILDPWYPKNNTVHLRSKATMKCIIIKGFNPNVTFKWFKWNKIPKTYPRKLNFSAENKLNALLNCTNFHTIASVSKLTIINARKKDLGMYTCCAMRSQVVMNCNSAVLSNWRPEPIGNGK